MRLRAPAKLNLYLRVVGKRPDGYHELETLFERIDLADELTFEPEPHGLRLTCDDPALPCDETNLVLQAARLLQRQSGVQQQGACIHLTKRIPVAAGLGGGSSDAAATLLGLNALWQLGWDRARLMELAAQVGSDAPFFLLEGPWAIGRGRGEVLEPVPTAASLLHVVVVPEERLSTREVFEGSGVKGFDLTASRPSRSIVEHALRNGSLGELASGLWNDLEPEAIRRCPVIARIQARVGALTRGGVLMSGSGSAVFGLCRDEVHAQAIATTLRTECPSTWRVEVVRTDSVSTIP